MFLTTSVEIQNVYLRSVFGFFLYGIVVQLAVPTSTSKTNLIANLPTAMGTYFYRFCKFNLVCVPFEEANDFGKPSEDIADCFTRCQLRLSGGDHLTNAVPINKQSIRTLCLMKE